MDAITLPPEPSYDTEHLRLLSLFHYIVGGLAGLFACFPIFHIAIGIMLIMSPQHVNNNPMPPAQFGWFFAILGSVLVLIGWTCASLIIVSGRFLAQRKSYTFCIVIGCIECLFMPFGTILGVFTLIVLNRPSVKAMFGPQYP